MERGEKKGGKGGKGDLKGGRGGELIYLHQPFSWLGGEGEERRAELKKGGRGGEKTNSSLSILSFRKRERGREKKPPKEKGRGRSRGMPHVFPSSQK